VIHPLLREHGAVLLATTQTATSTTKMMVMAARTAQPWRVSPTMAPKV